MKVISKDEFLLESGRRCAAYGGFFGIDDNLQITEGYDMPVHLADLNCSADHEYHCTGDEEWEGRCFTDSERIELADFMLNRWNRFRAQAARRRSEQFPGVYA